MTAKELAHALLECDEDVQEFEIGIISTAQIGKDIRINFRCSDIKMQENADIDGRMIWLKGKTYV